MCLAGAVGGLANRGIFLPRKFSAPHAWGATQNYLRGYRRSGRSLYGRRCGGYDEHEAWHGSPSKTASRLATGWRSFTQRQPQRSTGPHGAGGRACRSHQWTHRVVAFAGQRCWCVWPATCQIPSLKAHPTRSRPEVRRLRPVPAVRHPGFTGIQEGRGSLHPGSGGGRWTKCQQVSGAIHLRFDIPCVPRCQMTSNACWR
jgi:hypothetical protein